MKNTLYYEGVRNDTNHQNEGKTMKDDLVTMTCKTGNAHLLTIDEKEGRTKAMGTTAPETIPWDNHCVFGI